MRYTSMPNARSSTDASSAFASCDSIYSEEDDDDCQVLGSRPPPRNHREPVSPAASKSRNSSWARWEFRSCARRPSVAKQETRPTRQTRQTVQAASGEEKTEDSDCVGPELVDDSQQNLRKEWEAATLRRRTCPPMRSEGSKAGTNGWGSQAPQSARETDSSANLGGDSGTAETVQSNGHVSPVRDVSFQELSESTSTSSDSVVEVAEVEPRENGNAEPDEVVSASRKRPASSTAHQVFPESSGNSVLRSGDGEDPPVNNNSMFVEGEHPPPVNNGNSVFRNGDGEDPPEFAKASCSTDVRKSAKRRYEPPEEGHGASWSQLKFHGNGTDGASTSGHVGIDSLKHVDIGNKCTGDSGVLEPALDAAAAVGQDLLGGREKLKETADFKLADEEEWARRQQELQKQAQEARRLRERKRAEADRKNEVELRQKQRLEEIRQTQQKEERNMGLKNQIRSKVQAELERLASGCRDMATLLRLLQIPVEGGVCPTSQQVNAAYKKALLRFHPDRTSAFVQGDPQRQVEAEETFKLITRMKQLLKPSSMIAMAAR